jgi:hypothetical protein
MPHYTPGEMSEHTEGLQKIAERVRAARGFL